MKITYKVLSSAFLALFLLGTALTASPVHAQTSMPLPLCYSIPSNMRIGQQDSASVTDVSTLQNFLTGQGYFNAANLGTGHFGPLTLRAVERFQAAHGVPATGFVGPLTRAAIVKAQPTCVDTSMSPAKLYSLSPAEGAVGTQVNIRGFGFSNSNTILIDGYVAARDVPISSSIAISCTTDPSCHGGINQTLTFTLPSYVAPNCPVGSMCPMYVRELSAGTTTITVQNGGGESNALDFTITK